MKPTSPVALVYLACLAVANASAQAPAGKTRAADLDAFFAEVDKTYPFLDVKGIRKDWDKLKLDLRKRVATAKTDEAFMLLVVDAIKCLRDGHAAITETKVKLPPQPEYGPGVSFLPATNDRVVVMETVPELNKKLPCGTVVVQIDGQPARKFLDARGEAAWRAGGFFSSPQRARFFEYRLPLRGKQGDKHTIRYLDDGQEKSLELACRQEVGAWPHSHNQPAGLQTSAKSVAWADVDGIGYIYLRRMDETAEQGIAAAIAALPQAKGWVVDLSGNTGGGYDNTIREVLQRMKGSVAVMIDAGCVSAGETLARDLVRLCKARTFGEVSAGSSSQKKEWKFPSGIATVRFSTESRVGPDGKPIEFRGVVPDEIVEADPALMAAGKNTVLERALRYVHGEKARGQK